MNKILFTADWHLSNSWPYAVPDENGITNRLKDQISMIEQIGKIAEDEKVSSIFILGDLFDKSTLDAITLQYSLSAIIKLAKIASIYILPGNHDAKNSKAQHYAVDFLNELRDMTTIRILDGKSTLDVGSVIFHSVPWMPLEETSVALSNIKFVKKFTNVILLHHSIVGCKLDNWVIDEGLDSNEFGDHTYISGHIHKPQKFRNGFYVGAPIQKDFGDCGQGRRVVIGKFKDGAVQFEDRHIDAPEFQQFDGVSGGLDSITSGDYIRVKIQCTHAHYKTKLEEMKQHYETHERNGVNVYYQHIPISDHDVRMKTDGPIDYFKAMKEYIEISNTELNKKKLAIVGKKILESVKDA